MKSNVLIPLSTVALGACGPAFVGDFELNTFSATYDGDTQAIAGATGTMAIDGDLATELRINWTYDGYAYAISLDGDADEGDDDAFSLDLTGTFSYDGESYAATGDFDCTLDGDDVRCDGPFQADGYSLNITLEFSRE